MSWTKHLARAATLALAGSFFSLPAFAGGWHGVASANDDGTYKAIVYHFGGGKVTGEVVVGTYKCADEAAEKAQDEAFSRNQESGETDPNPPA